MVRVIVWWKKWWAGFTENTIKMAATTKGRDHLSTGTAQMKNPSHPAEPSQRTAAANCSCTFTATSLWRMKGKTPTSDCGAGLQRDTYARRRPARYCSRISATWKQKNLHKKHFKKVFVINFSGRMQLKSHLSCDGSRSIQFFYKTHSHEQYTTINIIKVY